MTLVELAELNHLPASAFRQSLHPFEAADPLADALYASRPFPSYPALIDRAEELARDLPEPVQVAVLAAHPRIGAPAPELSASSRREQGDTVSAAVLQALAELNSTYEQQFGFRFVVFVDGRSRAEIVDVLRARLRNPRDQELLTGLVDLFRIARDRYRRGE